jgi:hypothetical protein
MLVVLVTDVWVYADAKKLARRGTPVVFSLSFLRIETPEAWFLGCLILWIFFFPLYVTGRNRFA